MERKVIEVPREVIAFLCGREAAQERIKKGPLLVTVDEYEEWRRRLLERLGGCEDYDQLKQIFETERFPNSIRYAHWMFQFLVGGRDVLRGYLPKEDYIRFRRIAGTWSKAQAHAFYRLFEYLGRIAGFCPKV